MRCLGTHTSVTSTICLDMAKFEVGIVGLILVRDYPKQLWPAIVLGTLTNCGFDVPRGAGAMWLAIRDEGF